MRSGGGQMTIVQLIMSLACGAAGLKMAVAPYPGEAWIREAVEATKDHVHLPMVRSFHRSARMAPKVNRFCGWTCFGASLVLFTTAVLKFFGATT